MSLRGQRGVRKQSKIYGAFLYFFLELLVEMGGGGDYQIQGSWGTFCQTIGWIRTHKSASQVQKCWLKKSAQKVSKILGGGAQWASRPKLRISNKKYFLLNKFPQWLKSPPWWHTLWFVSKKILWRGVEKVFPRL